MIPNQLIKRHQSRRQFLLERNEERMPKNLRRLKRLKNLKIRPKK
jgi:hypothetical protein